jgi:hypothetical protein
MMWLAENELVIWIAGAVALTMALVVYWQTRSALAQGAVAAVVIITAALLVFERLVETPREAVERTLEEIVIAVRTNDMPGVLRNISRSAVALRADVEKAMPLVTIDRANTIGSILIDVDPNSPAQEATVKGRGFIHGTIRSNGMVAGQTAEFTVTFVREGDRWLLVDYAADKDNWRDELAR